MAPLSLLRPLQHARGFAPRDLLLVLGCWAVAGWLSPAQGFVAQDRWSNTAHGTAGSVGRAATLTWSVAPDGAATRSNGVSSLVQNLDAAFGVPGTSAAIEDRPWRGVIEAAFDRWSALSGVTFLYEPNDDGRPLSDSPGQLGVRGDIRLAGAPIDGLGLTRAIGGYPQNGDILVDTDDSSYLLNPTSDYLRLRNALAHEIGHALGLGHIASADAEFLMEPRLTTQFDGPQFDDIRGIQHLYGDRHERGGPNGNGLPSTATPLGSLAPGAAINVGADATGATAVGPDQADFVSIANFGDIDHYAFTVDAPTLLDVGLTPAGAVYRQGVENQPQATIDARASTDLSLAVMDASGVLLEVNDYAAGYGEAVHGLLLPAAGEYLVRVRGTRSAVQLYRLDLSATAAHAPEPAAAWCTVVGGLLLPSRACARRSISSGGRPAADPAKGVILYS